ncbi:MAG: hypothetical protein O3C43_01030 [Verrucomicrobia bacterium]|nr:hypothetical protein [Verrucomicrobiota bacterium]MDA1065062.1 hypothetical protein [Verrucomicrobiota bacterium]
MRTTLTIDDDLAHKLKLAASRQQKSFKEVVNQTLKKGLGSSSEKANRGRVKLKTQALSYHKGVDEVRLKDLLDELDVDEQAKS